MPKVDRIGERNINNFGSEMVIVDYRGALDIDVYFPEYDWIAKHRRYNAFKKGQIKCPYEKKVCGVGYLGEGDYKVSENGKNTRVYQTWQHMLERCYDEKYHEKYPTYIDCEVCEEWLCFQSFAEWFYDNYYTVDDETMCLDKDILVKGNKIYSPENCIFVPERINTLFVKSDKSRGYYPIGVNYNKVSEKFQARCNIYNYEENKKEKHSLGYYDTPQKAFEVYKEFKERYIKKVANYYKDKISSKLYKALYNYEVDIND